jgi:hypothetical protein
VVSSVQGAGVRVFVLALRDYEDTEIVGVYASKEAADKAETKWNKKNPFSPMVPMIEGPFLVHGPVAP